MVDDSTVTNTLVKLSHPELVGKINEAIKVPLLATCTLANRGCKFWLPLGSSTFITKVSPNVQFWPVTVIKIPLSV